MANYHWVQTPRLRVCFDLDHGGRMVSLSDAATGREWLVPPRPDRPETASYGSSFTNRHIHGWDEMLPTIEACTVDAVDLPDHGEIWAVPWTRTRACRPSGLCFEATARAIPLTLIREAWPDGDNLVLDYRLANHSAKPLPCLWAAHPQFHLTPRTEVTLRPKPSRARIASPAAPAEPRSWTSLVRQATGMPVGSHLKVWLDGPNLPTSVWLRDGDSALTMQWTGACLRGVAVLWDNAEFSSHPVLAVEPSTGRHDSLAAAVQANDATILRPGEQLRWSVTLAMG